MFGKGRRTKSSNEKFVIARGVDAGNLKGRGKADKTAPMHKGTSLATPAMQPASRKTSPGKFGPVKATGD